MDLIDLSIAAGLTVKPQIGGVDLSVIHAPEQLGTNILEPVRIQIHHAELSQRVDVYRRRDNRIGT
ncbi:hypothetical protein RA996_08635, partial [Mycobacteroides abscessus subsp. abscessus]